MRAKNPLKTFSKNENLSIFLVLVVMVVVVILVEFFFVRNMNIGSVAFVRPGNIGNVLMQVSITGMLALGMTMIMISGGIDLSVGQMMCFVGTGMAYLIKTMGWNEWGTAVLALFVAVVFQLFMGLIISRTKIEAFIVSLGFMSIYKGFTYIITRGREITILGRFTFIGRTSFNITDNFRLGMPVIIFILLTVILWLVFKYTKFGRRVYAVGGNENAAFLAGINVKNFKLLLYGLNGVFVAIATMAQLSRLGVGNPLMGEGMEIEVIAAVVVGGVALKGGKGNAWGTFIGVLLLGIISNALNILGVNPYFQYVMRGTLIIFAVTLTYYSTLRSESMSLRAKVKK